LKVREAFQILTQGVEMVHYDLSAKGGAKKSKKIVWMVSYKLLLLLLFVVHNHLLLTLLLNYDTLGCLFCAIGP
jgi:hypothetical protein